MATYKELKIELEKLQGEAEQARLAEKAEILDKVRALIIEHELQPSDLGFKQARARSTGTVAPKYKDPATGATWSGRGRAPGWLQGDRSTYEI